MTQRFCNISVTWDRIWYFVEVVKATNQTGICQARLILPRYFQRITVTAWTASITYGTCRKLALTKILQNFWFTQVLLERCSDLAHGLKKKALSEDQTHYSLVTELREKFIKHFTRVVTYQINFAYSQKCWALSKNRT